MKHFEETWISWDQLKVYSQGWEPNTQQPKCVVCLVHGLGEHSGRYALLAERLTQAGFCVIGFDLRGHGKSAGQRGHVGSSLEFIAEIDKLILTAHKHYPDKPCFLYGHSLGGLLVLFYALKQKPDLTGLVASSPGLRSSLEQQKLKVALVKRLAVVFPKLSIPSGLNPEHLSRDPEVVRNYLSDSLVHNQVSLKMANTMLDMIAYSFDHAQELNTPLLIMHGTADQIVYPSGSTEIAEKVTCESTLQLWEDFLHETHNEPGKEEVIDFLIRWLESRI